MKVVLKGISQDVDLADPKSTRNFLVHADEAGREFRVPVDEETVQNLLKWIHSLSPAAQPEVEEEPSEAPTEDDLSAATEFSAEEEEALAAQMQEEEQAQEDAEGPDSEDEVKSL